MRSVPETGMVMYGSHTHSSLKRKCRGEPEEVATVMRILCGPDARYIAGQTIHFNGGGFMP